MLIDCVKMRNIGDMMFCKYRRNVLNNCCNFIIFSLTAKRKSYIYSVQNDLFNIGCHRDISGVEFL